MSRKNFFLFSVLFPLFFPVFDFFIGSFFSDFSLVFFRFFIPDEFWGTMNFYNYSFNRIISFVLISMYPIMIFYDVTHVSIEEIRSSYSAGKLKLIFVMTSVFFLLLSLAFLPINYVEPYSRHELSMVNVHKSPFQFIFTIYFALYLIPRFIAFSLKRVFFMWSDFNE